MNEEDIKYLEMLKDMIDEKYGNGKKYKQAIENLIYKIKKLETDKRNLIEKLEKANKLETETVRYYEEMYRNTTDSFYKKVTKERLIWLMQEEKQEKIF